MPPTATQSLLVCVVKMAQCAAPLDMQVNVHELCSLRLLSRVELPRPSHDTSGNTPANLCTSLTSLVMNVQRAKKGSCAGLTALLTALLSSAGGLAFLEADADSVRRLMDVLWPGASSMPLLCSTADGPAPGGYAVWSRLWAAFTR